MNNSNFEEMKREERKIKLVNILYQSSRRLMCKDEIGLMIDMYLNLNIQYKIKVITNKDKFKRLTQYNTCIGYKVNGLFKELATEFVYVPIPTVKYIDHIIYIYVNENLEQVNPRIEQNVDEMVNILDTKFGPFHKNTLALLKTNLAQVYKEYPLLYDKFDKILMVELKSLKEFNDIAIFQVPNVLSIAFEYTVINLLNTNPTETQMIFVNCGCKNLKVIVMYDPNKSIEK